MRSSDGAAAVIAGLAALDAEDVTSLPDAVLRDELAELVVTVNRLHAQVLRRVAAFDARGLAGADGCRSAKAWLRAFGRLSEALAGAWVKAARLLRELPALAEAFSTGDASVEHVNRLARLADRVGVGNVRELDAVLAGAAAELDPGDLQKVCDRVRAHLDPDGSQPDPHEDFQRRGITLSHFDGMVLVRGQLDPEGGAALLTALDAMMTPPADSDERTPAQRRADALVELARGALTSGRLPTVGGVRPQVGILLGPQTLLHHDPANHEPPTRDEPANHDAYAQPADTACGGPDDALSRAGIPPPPEATWLQWFGPIPGTVAQRIACDADIWRVVLDPATGLPLDVGRSHRMVPHWIRKALWARDRGCRFPGCRAPAQWTDAHHVRVPWARGGRTEIDNLVLLCRHHHVLVHEGGWTIHLDRATGTVTANRPGGLPYRIRASRPWTGPTIQAA